MTFCCCSNWQPVNIVWVPSASSAGISTSPAFHPLTWTPHLSGTAKPKSAFTWRTVPAVGPSSRSYLGQVSTAVPVSFVAFFISLGTGSDVAGNPMRPTSQLGKAQPASLWLGPHWLDILYQACLPRARLIKKKKYLTPLYYELFYKITIKNSGPIKITLFPANIFQAPHHICQQQECLRQWRQMSILALRKHCVNDLQIMQAKIRSEVNIS